MVISRPGIMLLALILLTGSAAAQRETVSMTVLSSYRAGAKTDTTLATGLFLSDDGGTAWRHSGWRDYDRVFYSEEASDGTLWSACGNGILRSTDSGKSWRVTTGWEITEVLKVKVAEMNPALVFASTAYGIVRSTDHGSTWERKVAGLRRPYSGDLCIDRTDADHIVAATEEGVYQSTDGGEHWLARWPSGTAIRVVVQDPTDARRFWIGTEEGDVFVSSDGGVGWEMRSTGLEHHTVYAIALHPTQAGRLYVATFEGGVYLSTDAGARWSQRSRGLTDLRVHALLVLPSHPQRLLAGTLNKGLFLSSDGGESWHFNSQDDSQVWGLSVRSTQSRR